MYLAIMETSYQTYLFIINSCSGRTTLKIAVANGKCNDCDLLNSPPGDSAVRPPGFLDSGVGGSRPPSERCFYTT